MSDQQKQQLRIQAAAVTRILKDIALYKREAEAQGQKIAEMRLAASDKHEDYIHDIRKQEEVLEECQSMIPHALSQLAGFVESLRALAGDQEVRDALSGSAELGLADDALAAASSSAE